MDLGSRLKILRESKRLKQEDITKRFSLTGSGYSQYENNKRRPSYELLSEFADFYDVSIDYLLGRIDTHYPFASKKVGKYSETELAIIYMLHEMDEQHRESIHDYVQFVFDLYKKEKLNEKNAVS